MNEPERRHFFPMDPPQLQLNFEKSKFNEWVKPPAVKRFVGARFNRREVLLSLLILFLNLFSLVMAIIIHRILIPNTVQSKLNQTVDDYRNGRNTLVQDLQVQIPPFTPQSIPVKLKYNLDVTGLGDLELSPFTIDLFVEHSGLPASKVFSIATGKTLVSLVAPKNIETDIAVNFGDPDKQLIANAMKQFSQQGLKSVFVTARMNVPVKLLGIQWYSGMPLYVDLSFGDISNLLAVPSTTNQTTPCNSS